MNKINYQKVLEQELDHIKKAGITPKLLLHSCCAPCSSYVLEYLSDYFYITVFFYNPNITSHEEYNTRILEQEKFIKSIKTKYPINFLKSNYDPKEFFSEIKGLEGIKEGGERCFRCYELRLRKSAEVSSIHNFDYFCTTLTISPLKNSKKINEIGKKLEEDYNIKFLESDFKKKNGYKRSIELSKLYGLYRQNYCGCIYSKLESEEEKSN